MTRFMLDANALMNAALVVDSVAREIVDAIAADSSSSIYIDEMTWLEIQKVLTRKVGELRLQFQPFQVVQEFAGS